MTFVRGSNPIWLEVDLTGNLFDDTFYLFVLENNVPYIPATVWHDPSGTIPWTNPIQFLANGTLPIDIFFDSEVVYRLEFRKGPTQSDPLIYLVENYVPGNGVPTPSDLVSIFTDNQVTNPQFSIISFSSPLTVTNPAAPIEVAPGWFLNTTGSGTVVLTRIPLNNTLSNPTNAPYALEINVSGSFSEVYLSQRFEQNGMLWAGKRVASSITARIEGAPQFISATLVDSNGTPLTTVLSSTEVNDEFNEYTGFGLLPDTTNPDLPPAAYIEYRLLLPTAVDIFVTSFQLVASDLDIEFTYEEDTIDRQIDHTFHYYRDSILFMPKESLLTGWNFGLNPWQFTTTTSTTLAAQCAYTADQTIVYQQAGGSEVAIGQGTAAENYAFEVKAIGNNNRFALIQYIDPATIRPYWNEIVSSLVKASIASPTHGTTVRFKMRLIYRTSLPSTIGAAEPILSWVGSGDPTFAAGWTALTPINDPVYTFTDTANEFVFNGFDLPLSSSDDMTLGIVLYTLDPIVETATADRILFDRVSLMRNDFAIDCDVLTFDETLRRCQYYIESSADPGTLPTQTPLNSYLMKMQFAGQDTTSISLFPRSFNIEYNVVKRAAASTLLYDTGGTVGQVTAFVRFNGAQIGTAAANVSNWSSVVNAGAKGIDYQATGTTGIAGSVHTLNNTAEAFILFHYLADARLGV